MPSRFLFVTSTGKEKPGHTAERRRHVMQQQSPADLARMHWKQNEKQPTLNNHTAGRITFQLNENVRLPTSDAGTHESRLVHGTRGRDGGGTAIATQVSLRRELEAEHDVEERHPGSANGAFQLDSAANQIPRDHGAAGRRLRQLRLSDISPEEKQRLLTLSTSPLLFFGASSIDPLHTLPVSLTPWDSALLARFAHNKKWPWCPVRSQSEWSTFAMTNEMLFSATLYAWSMAFRNRLASPSEAVTFLEDNPEVLTHKLKAITLINKSLSNTAASLSDATLASIAALANLELIFGSYQAATYHISGLRRLVVLRGGLNFSTATVLQQLIYRLISWTGLVYSNVYHAPLYFPALELWDKSWKTLDSFSIPGSPICYTPQGLWSEGVDNYEVVDILEGVRRLCQAEREKPRLSLLDEHENMLRADMCASLETRLTRIITSIDALAAAGSDLLSNEARKSTWNSSLWQSIALTALIYIHHFLRGTDLRARQFRVWTKSLRGALDARMDGHGSESGTDADTTSLSLRYAATDGNVPSPAASMKQFFFSRSLLLWVLSVGATASMPSLGGNVVPSDVVPNVVLTTTDHDFFINQLRWARVHYSLTWQDYLSAIQDYFWTGEVDERRYWGVWAELADVSNGQGESEPTSGPIR
ncbi:uncharacterized protein AB675_8487 [Cyphellophora attinorum]|uniref:Transcription factor domain-containing protein n=1 Tax=Cyphellophora attinorum TaxID=1664694 RepID=A0A0N0NQV8_9EURO|nr:uncharacterized protein AB675_8487 [Phialophora attinorum]KPI44368.1 hypothetical protein AB675_8487 [Phialophora attinorum]